jgi:hypothetical protein
MPLWTQPHDLTQRDALAAVTLRAFITWRLTIAWSTVAIMCSNRCAEPPQAMPELRQAQCQPGRFIQAPNSSTAEAVRDQQGVCGGWW